MIKKTQENNFKIKLKNLNFCIGICWLGQKMRAYLKEFPVARVSFRKPPIVFGQKQERARPPKLHCTEGQEEKGIEDRRMSTVCVTGGAGHIATWLINKLLCRGCVVHATLRNLGNNLLPHPHSSQPRWISSLQHMKPSAINSVMILFSR